MIGVILLGRTVKANVNVIKTLEKLSLKRKNSLVIIPKTQSNIGMLKKIEPYITWGEVSDETINLLKQRRKPIINKKNKLLFRLNPPRRGFERKGIKKPFNLGGAYGYRGSKINDLIKRMV